MPINCPICQQTNPDAARYCQYCGAVVAPVAPAAPIAEPIGAGKTRAYATTTSNGNGFSQLELGPSSSVVPVASPAIGMQREQLVLVIDASGSMGEVFDNGVTKLEAAIRGGCNLIANKAQIDDEDEAGLVTFTDRGNLVCPIRPLRGDKANLFRRLQQLSIGGGTDLNEGLLVAERALDWHRQGIVRRIVILTDGEGGEPLRTGQRLRDAGVVIDIIGVGPTPERVNEPLLKQLASRISGELHYRFIRDHQSLIAHYTALGQKTRLGAGG